MKSILCKALPNKPRHPVTLSMPQDSAFPSQLLLPQLLVKRTAQPIHTNHLPSSSFNQQNSPSVATTSLISLPTHPVHNPRRNPTLFLNLPPIWSPTSTLNHPTPHSHSTSGLSLNRSYEAKAPKPASAPSSTQTQPFSTPPVTR